MGEYQLCMLYVMFAVLNVVAFDFVRRNLLETTAWFLLPVQLENRVTYNA